MKILLLGASFLTDNMGVGALAAGSVKSIVTGCPGAEIVVLDYAREGAVFSVPVGRQTVSIPLVNLRFSKKIYLKNNIVPLLGIALVRRLLPFPAWGRSIAESNPSLREITRADLCLAISGGDSFSDIYGLPRLLYVSLPQILILLLGKRLVLLPQTIGPFGGRLARSIARFIVRKAERVYSRDQQGVSAARSLAGGSAEHDRVRFCYDVGFALDPIAPPRVECEGLTLDSPRSAPLVGLNVSGLLYMGGYSRKNMFGLAVNYPDLVNALIDLFVTRLNAPVLLVPHVFGSEAGGESDSAICKKLFRDLAERYPGRLGWIAGKYDQNQIKHIIGQCDFVVGSRMHACIAALSQGVPAMAIAYSDKFIGVMETIGVPSLVMDPRKMTQEDILQHVSRVFAERQAVRRQLEQIMPAVRQTVLSLFTEIAGPAEGVKM